MLLSARNNRIINGETCTKGQSSLFPSVKNVDRGEIWYNKDETHDSDEGVHNWIDKRRRNIGSTHLWRLIVRWRLLNFSTRIAFVVASLLILFVVFIRLWDQLFYQIDSSGEIILSSSISSFAVVINTFRRPERLKETVRHYAETCGRRYNVGQVFVVWADPKTEPPPSGDYFFYRNASSDEKVTNMANIPVEILLKTKDSLNARFEPIPQLRTTSIFMVDDDIRVSCSSLQIAFQAWKNHPYSMVGYYPRLAADRSISLAPSDTLIHKQKLVYHGWPMVYWRQKFNIILTKASFLHSRYLEIYTNDDSFPKEIKDYIDKHQNCEDIAMSMLVANYTKHYVHNVSKAAATTREKLSARPFYVEGHVSDVGLFGGISSGTGHFATRSDCLNELTNIFHSKGWGSPLEDEFDLLSGSWIKHAPGFWWQSSPSNTFEWFGLANILS